MHQILKLFKKSVVNLSHTQKKKQKNFQYKIRVEYVQQKCI